MTRCDHQLQLLFVFDTMKRLFSKWRAPLKRRHRYNGSVHTSPLRKHVPLRGKFRGEQERYRCSLRNESRTSCGQSSTSTTIFHFASNKILPRSGPNLEISEKLGVELIDRRTGGWGGEGIIVGNWVSHTTVSRKSHFQPSLAVKGSRADYRVAARNIGGSCEKRRIQLASAPLWFSCEGWGVGAVSFVERARLSTLW